MEEYENTKFAIMEFLYRLWKAEKRGGHTGRRDRNHPEDV